MSADSATHRPRAFWDALTILLFLVVLWLPTLDSFFDLDDTPIADENRLPARWPHFAGLARSREFITGAENYFNDRFGFRYRLIHWNHHWKNQWFRTKTSGDTVLFGRDGWLFYAGEQMLEHWTHQLVWAEQDLRDWRRLLELRRDWLRSHGIQYLFIVPPDKQTVYPEYLPPWMEPRSKPSKLQQLAEYLKNQSDVEFIDLSQPLIDAKKIRVNYLQTDTHWNAFGSFVGYRTLVQSLSRQLPGLEPLPLDAYEWKPTPYPAGDLAKLAGNDTCQENAGFTPLPRQPLSPLTVIYDSISLPQQDSNESTPCYTHICHTHNDKASGKALIFRDSFAESWYPLLGLHFREVIYVWSYNWDWSLIEREKPDVVIDEMLERFLNIQSPADLMRQDRLSATGVVPKPL